VSSPQFPQKVPLLCRGKSLAMLSGCSSTAFITISFAGLLSH
jgi:hypothetical protein